MGKVTKSATCAIFLQATTFAIQIKHNAMEINFFRVATKSNAKGKAPIWGRITHNNKRAYISTGIDLTIDEWEQQTQQVVKNRLAESYNNAIVQLKSKVYDTYTTLKRKNEPVTAALIKHHATREVEVILFSRVIDEYISGRFTDTQEIRKNVKGKLIIIKPTIELATYKAISYKVNNIKAFLKHIRMPNLLASELSPALLTRYRQWLATDLGSQSEQYAHKCLYLWQELERYAYNKSYIDRLNLLTYMVAKGFGSGCDEVPHLTEFELDAMYNSIITHPLLEKVKDLFLFQCYTGMAYVDSQLYRDEMIHYQEGIPYIKYYRKKIRNNRALATPLLTVEAKAISDKYNGQAPQLVLQTYNEWLKLLQATCNIPTKLSSHVGRKTFGMRMLNTFGFKMEEVSRMLGHSSVKMTEKVYAKVTVDRVITAAYSLNVAA